MLAVRTIAGSRPSNHLADRADELTLGPSSDHTGPVLVHSEVYDLADSGRIGEETLDNCAGDSVPTDSRGVCFRAAPQQEGRITFPSRPNRYAFFTADRQTCLAGDTYPDSEENTLALKVNIGSEILIFLGQRPSSDFKLQRIGIEFEALRFKSHDCDLAPTDSEEGPVGCGTPLSDKLYGEFALENRSEVTSQVVEDLGPDEDTGDAAVEDLSGPDENVPDAAGAVCGPSRWSGCPGVRRRSNRANHAWPTPKPQLVAGTSAWMIRCKPRSGE